MNNQDSLNYKRYHGTLSVREKITLFKQHNKQSILRYIISYIPIVTWLPNYKLKWLTNDIISGITVAIMMIPQCIAYSTLAQLPVITGLYSGCISSLVYPLFGTSREVSVGPTSMVWLMMGNLINQIQSNHPEYTNSEIAIHITFLSFIIVLFIGLFRLGFILDIIPQIVILGFTTGAALTIMLAQLANLLGVSGVNSNAPTIDVLTALFHSLYKSNLIDLAFGISSLIFLLIIQILNYKFKHPIIKYLGIASNGVTIILFTILSYGLHLNNDSIKLKIVGSISSGFINISIPKLKPELLSLVSSSLVSAILLGVLEHIALCKAFSKKSGYNIKASQELFSLGVLNMINLFFNASSSTGAFSRSAVNYQSKVNTPLASSFTGLLLLVILFCATKLFYYIPSATLAAIIIISVSKLITSYKQTIQIFKVSKLDGLIFFITVFLTLFLGTEISILSSLCFYFLSLLYKLITPPLFILYKVQNSDIYLDSQHPDYPFDTPLDGVVILQWRENINFVNIETFKNKVLDKLESLKNISHNDVWCTKKSNKLDNESSISADFPALTTLLLDLNAVNDIDSCGILGLINLMDSINQQHSDLDIHFITTLPKIMNAIKKINHVSFNNSNSIKETALFDSATKFHISINDAILFLQK